MNSNNLNEISHIIANLASEKEIKKFLNEIFTSSEIETLSKRWQILSMLHKGETQRTIAQKLKVSLCKVTRGAKIIQDKNSIITKYLQEREDNVDKK